MAPEKTGIHVTNASRTVQVPVWATVAPETVDEVAVAIRRSTGRLSVSSARYSPDGQFALAGALHIDLSRLNRVIRFEPMDGVIRVQAGIRWSELLRFIQPHGFAPRVMPLFANFSVGGSVASNAHGSAVATGPISQSVRALRVVLAGGTVVETSADEKPDLFAALIGGMGGVGVIVEVELQLTDNRRLMRKSVTMPSDHYVDYFKARIASDPGAILHAAEFYPPTFRKLRANTWVVTEERCTDDRPLHLSSVEDPLSKVFDWSRSPSWFSRLRDELVIEPIRYARKAVHWRNFEASQDLAEFDAKIHQDPLLELQEYVVDVAQVPQFLAQLQAVVARYRVPAVHLSIRHYGCCPVSYLSLGTRDSIAFLLAVRSRPADTLKADYAVWSRELVDAALACGGRFNPAYMMHATAEQFAAAFARREELLAAKRRYDPGNRFGNGLWARYLDAAGAEEAAPAPVSEFRAAFASANSRDAVYRLFAECGPRRYAPRLFGLLDRMVQRNEDDELVYRSLRASLLKWQSAPLAPLLMRPSNWQLDLHRRLARLGRDRLRARPFLAVAASAVAASAMAASAVAGGAGSGGRGRRGDRPRVDGYLDVGSGGRQSRALRRHLKFTGVVRALDLAGQPVSRPAADWVGARLPARALPGHGFGWGEGAGQPPLAAASVDLITIYSGLSALPEDRLAACLFALGSALRPGGLLLLLDHDAHDGQTALDASMAVNIASLCAGDRWEDCQSHPRAFRAADDWRDLLAQHGLVEIGERTTLDRSPFGDTLLTFCRRDAGGGANGLGSADNTGGVDNAVGAGNADGAGNAGTAGAGPADGAAPSDLV
ncbi:MAG: FAD-dependent oxidoreductase [Lautropia sp.]